MCLSLQDVVDILRSIAPRESRVVIYDFACGVVSKLIKDKNEILIDLKTRGLPVRSDAELRTNDDGSFVKGQLSLSDLCDQAADGSSSAS